MMSIKEIKEIAILNINGADYRCIIGELAKVKPWIYCEMVT